MNANRPDYYGPVPLFLESKPLSLTRAAEEHYFQFMSEPVAASSLFHELVDAFARCLPRESVQALANFQVSDAILGRLDALAAKANEGRLSAEEDADYRAFIELAELLAVLRLRARTGS